MTERLITVSDAANQLGVTKKTLQVWDREGKLVALRTAGGHRRYLQSDIEKLQGIEHDSVERNQVADVCTKSLDNDEESAYVVCMKRVNFHLTPGQVKSLKARSDKSGLSVAELIRRAIDYWLENTEDKRDGKAEEKR